MDRRMIEPGLRGETAWLLAKASTVELVEHESPHMQYALRRIGGRERLEGRMREFAQAWNEAPFVDADEDTLRFVDEVLVRTHESKDGV